NATWVAATVSSRHHKRPSDEVGAASTDRMERISRSAGFRQPDVTERLTSASAPPATVKV
ncbi:MAG TPA: hypothetical protein VK065_04940, partial [Brevibacterium sp.]|nr:hypothetical protein [Brevibacterium sp.]